MSSSTSCMNEDIKAKSISPSLLTGDVYKRQLHEQIKGYQILLAGLSQFTRAMIARKSIVLNFVITIAVSYTHLS